MASCHNTDALPETNGAAGAPESVKHRALELGAAAVQDFGPIKNICAHLNAFHVYANDTGRFVETNHYCSHLNDDVRQCLLYDSPEPNARLLGIEYMISSKLFETLPAEERRFWHSHVFEVHSGMLIMPLPSSSLVPNAAWSLAETEEMKSVVHLYGKIFQLWDVSRGDKVPMGEPQLMMSFTGEGQFDFETHVGARDERFRTDWRKKQEDRAAVEKPEVLSGADSCWKK